MRRLISVLSLMLVLSCASAPGGQRDVVTVELDNNWHDQVFLYAVQRGVERPIGRCDPMRTCHFNVGSGTFLSGRVDWVTREARGRHVRGQFVPGGVPASLSDTLVVGVGPAGVRSSIFSIRRGR